ncbi:MAG TPA: helix-turn-helix domain-containing protein [Acidimicrobiia bacterium]
MKTHLFAERRELTYRALADPTRRHLLRLLDDADQPTEVGELSTQIGLHPNTVRAHLELLRHAGMVTRSTEPRSRPGRPKMLYRSAPRRTRSPGAEGYQFLAEVLAACLRAHVDDPAAASEEAGRAWGRYMVDRPEPYARLGAAEVVGQMVTALAELGFAPEETQEGERIQVRLHDCPFREVAQANRDVVCSIHLGILRGMAEELGDSVSVEDLQPFVEPSLCIASLSAV